MFDEGVYTCEVMVAKNAIIKVFLGIYSYAPGMGVGRRRRWYVSVTGYDPLFHPPHTSLTSPYPFCTHPSLFIITFPPSNTSLSYLPHPPPHQPTTPSSTSTHHHTLHHTLHPTHLPHPLHPSGAPPLITSEMSYRLQTPLNVDPPVFQLNYTSRGLPATDVVWTVGDVISNDGIRDQVVSNPETAEYINTLTITGRRNGTYRCSVTSLDSSGGVVYMTSKSLYIEGKFKPLCVCV